MSIYTERFQIGLNIHLLAFALPKSIIEDDEEVRVSITTVPEERKQHFSIRGQKMANSNHIFSLNISSNTNKVIMVFRKVATFSDKSPIIASTTIKFNEIKEFPKERINNGMIVTDTKHINLFYPLQKQIHEEGTKKIQRKVLGQMECQFTFTAPFEIMKTSDKDSKKNNNNCQMKKNIQPFFFKSNKLLNKSGKKGGEYEKLMDNNNFYDSYLL